MAENNEDIPTLNDGPTQDPPARSFDPEQMVRCDECLRANPPTRANCLYCGTALPVQPSTVVLQKPTLRPLEKWEHGYNIIHLPSGATLSESSVAEVANFLQLETEDLRRIVSAETPLPLARTSGKDEAALIEERLKAAGINSLTVPDTSLGLDSPLKLRALEFREDGFAAHQSPHLPPIEISWSDLVLVVSGRITRKRVELTEERKRRENRVLEADQFFADESVLHLFTSHANAPFLIASGSFDFSCLAETKRLVAAENLSLLVDAVREKASAITHDQAYNSLRKTLEPVWKSEQQNESKGLRRGRPGKLNLSSATETSNESQFSRYARLRYYLLTHDQIGGVDA